MNEALRVFLNKASAKAPRPKASAVARCRGGGEIVGSVTATAGAGSAPGGFWFSGVRSWRQGGANVQVGVEVDLAGSTCGGRAKMHTSRVGPPAGEGRGLMVETPGVGDLCQSWSVPVASSVGGDGRAPTQGQPGQEPPGGGHDRGALEDDSGAHATSRCSGLGGGVR